MAYTKSMRNVFAFIIFLIILVSSGFSLFDQYNDKIAIAIPTASSPVAIQNPKEYAGVISTNTSGQQIYTNKRYGFQFIYPEGWRVGDNILGLPYGGTLQLFNSSRKDSRQSRGFANGENKIEVALILTASSSAMLLSSSSDYPTKSRESIFLSFLGGIVAGIDVELIGGERSRTYSVPLGAVPDKSLLISIYGEPSNFYVLDNLVKSISWE